MKNIFLITIVLLLLGSCKPTQDNPEKDFRIDILDKDKTETFMTSEGGSVNIAFQSTCDWSTNIVKVGSDPWCQVSPSQGSAGDNAITITVLPNETYDGREAKIILRDEAGNAADTINIYQLQKDAIIIAKKEYEFEAKGGEMEVVAMANIELSISIPDSCTSWISQVQTKALEEKVLYFAIAKNESGARTGKIIISNGEVAQEITILQKSGEVVKVDPDSVPANEIWYRTLDGEKYDFNAIPFSEHVYENTVWKLKFASDITMLPRYSFYNYAERVSEIYLPNSIQTMESYSIFNTSIQSLHIPKELKEAQTNAIYQNFNLKRLTGHHVSDDSLCLILDKKLILFVGGGSEEYTLPEGIEILGQQSIIVDPSLKTLVIPEGVTTLESKGGSSIICPLYEDNIQLETISLPASLTEWDVYLYLNIHTIKKFVGDCKYISDDGLMIIQENYNNLGSTFLLNYANAAENTMVEIPEGVEAIGNYAFYRAENVKEVRFPKSLTIFASGDSFSKTYNIEKIYGENVAQDNRSLVIDNTLIYVAPKGLVEYTTPAGVTKLNYGVLAGFPELESVTISDDVLSVGSAITCNPYEIPLGYILWNNPKLKKVTISANMRLLGMDPFGNYDNVPEDLQEVYLRSPIPPVLGFNFPDEAASFFNKLKIYVPEESYNTYLQSPDWQPYKKFITSYKYEDLPEINTYYSKDYSKDGDVFTLQTATKGNGIDIVFMGDAYSDRQINDGTYRQDMETMYENMFNIEPYKSFKDHFNVYIVNAVSATEGYEYGNTTFDTWFGAGTFVDGNQSLTLKYALNAISEERMDEAMIVVAMNSNNYAGTCHMIAPESDKVTDYGSGVTISYFPKGDNTETFIQLLHHEACGHGFTKLIDEYAYEYKGQITSGEIEAIQHLQNNAGWYKNIDFTDDPTKVRWSHFINDPRYAGEGLGAFEGGATYWTGAWRPTVNSIMRDNTGGFNAPSREAIYYRIHKLAYGDDWEFDYEEFAKYDEINRKSADTQTTSAMVQRRHTPTHPPVIVNKSWRQILKEGEAK